MQYLTDPYEHLKDYCLQHDFKLIYMDISVKDIITDVTYANLKTQTLPKEALGQFDIDEVFIDAVHIEQKFAIEEVAAKAPRCDFRLAADKTVEKVAAVFYAEQCDLEADDDLLADEIEENIIRKLIKARVLVGIRQLYDREKILAAINAMRNGKQKVSLPLAQGVAAIEGKPARIIDHYKETRDKKVHNERGFVYPIKQGDLVVEYRFATPNRNGRNMLGTELVSELVRANREVPFKIDETLYEKRDNDSVRCYAAQPGFVDYIGYKALYSIKDEMALKAVNFKDTGSINGGGRDNNITLRINEMDDMSDAVGANVTLHVAKLKIDGSVAQNATIKSVTAEIGGQTHKSSKIFANQCDINRHRGFVKGDDVKITTLEGGSVDAKKVQIGSALGGEINAKICEVESALANTSYTVTSFLKIKKCSGENIRITVTLANDEKFKEQIERIEKANKERELPLENLPRKVSVKRSLIEKNRDSIAAIQNKLKEFAAQGVAAPAAFTIKVKEFRALLDEYNKLNDELADLRAKQARDDETLSMLQEKIFSAKVECLSPWKNACEVRFELLNPHKTISWISEPGEVANLIYLAKDGENVYIKKEKY